MFSAFKNAGSWLNSNTFLTFDGFLVDIGHTLDINTGTFTTPFNAYYEFSFFGYAEKDTEIEVQKNGSKMVSFKSSEKDHNNYGTTWQMKLIKGDKIRLKVRTGGIHSISTYYTIFSGKSIGF